MRFRYFGNIALALAALITGSAFASGTSLSAGAASKLLGKQVEQDGRYQGRLPFKCMRFVLKDTTPRYIELAIAAKTDEGCSTGPALATPADQFRVNRQTHEILRLDPQSGSFKPYSEAIPVPGK